MEWRNEAQHGNPMPGHRTVPAQYHATVPKMRPRAAVRAGRQAARAAREARIDAEDRAAAERLAEVSLGPGTPPPFTQACPDGTCARCHGSQFARVAAIFTGPAGDTTECVTCGARYTVG